MCWTSSFGQLYFFAPNNKYTQPYTYNISNDSNFWEFIVIEAKTSGYNISEGPIWFETHFVSIIMLYMKVWGSWFEFVIGIRRSFSKGTKVHLSFTQYSLVK